MSETAGHSQAFSVFRVIVIVLLTIIAILQFLTLQRLSRSYVTLEDLRATRDPKVRRLLHNSVPLVGVYGSVDVEGPVEVQGTVDANVTNEPLGVQAW